MPVSAVKYAHARYLLVRLTSIIILPVGLPSIAMSKNTLGFDMVIGGDGV